MSKTNVPAKVKKNEMVSINMGDPMNVNGASEALGESIDIRKIQQRPKAGLKVGMITDVEGTQYESIKFIWLGLTLSHALFPKFDPNNLNQKTLCKSKDGQVPSSGTDMRPGPCIKCPEAE